jgi:hypothetical protein
MHPQPRVQKKAHELVTTGHRNTRHSLRSGFNGLFRALPGDRAFLPPSLSRMTPRHLAPASGRQDHTALPSALALFVKSAAASTASRPAFVTCARPSVGQDARINAPDLPDVLSGIFLRMGLDRRVEKLPDGQISLKSFSKLEHIVLLLSPHCRPKAATTHYGPVSSILAADLIRRAIPFHIFPAQRHGRGFARNARSNWRWSYPSDIEDLETEPERR